MQILTSGISRCQDPKTERTGFEPAEDSRPHGFSKPALSTTQPPLQPRTSRGMPPLPMVETPLTPVLPPPGPWRRLFSSLPPLGRPLIRVSLLRGRLRSSGPHRTPISGSASPPPAAASALPRRCQTTISTAGVAPATARCRGERRRVVAVAGRRWGRLCKPQFGHRLSAFGMDEYAHLRTYGSAILSPVCSTQRRSRRRWSSTTSRYFGSSARFTISPGSLFRSMSCSRWFPLA